MIVGRVRSSFLLGLDFSTVGCTWIFRICVVKFVREIHGQKQPTKFGRNCIYLEDPGLHLFSEASKMSMKMSSPNVGLVTRLSHFQKVHFFNLPSVESVGNLRSFG